MTRKDFLLIEEILRDIREPLTKEKFGDCWMLVVLAFKAELRMRFAHFDQDKFLHNVIDK
jgi:hypothetical protein